MKQIPTIRRQHHTRTFIQYLHGTNMQIQMTAILLQTYSIKSKIRRIRFQKGSNFPYRIVHKKRVRHNHVKVYFGQKQHNSNHETSCSFSYCMHCNTPLPQRLHLFIDRRNYSTLFFIGEEGKFYSPRILCLAFFFSFGF